MSHYRAVFARGGTSKALIFRIADLPAERGQWDAIFAAAMGSPDPYGRQLDGMGGGVSSLSKVCVVGPSSRADADVDYLFGQVSVKERRVDYSGNCGNMSSAIGPFAVDEGLVERPRGNETTVRIHNVNTGKIIHATFPVRDGRSVSQGELVIPGVSGSGAPVRLDFLDPGGASTGRLLPSGNVLDTFDVAGFGPVHVSMVDAANACVFVEARAFGLKGTELPEEIEAAPGLLEQLAAVRVQASVAMGISKSLQEARSIPLVPFIGMVAPPADAVTLSGEAVSAHEIDLLVRMISNGQPHRALPLTASLCTAVATQITGTLPNTMARPPSGAALRLGMPSGILSVAAAVSNSEGDWKALHGSFFRTTRRLFAGDVYV